MAPPGLPADELGAAVERLVQASRSEDTLIVHVLSHGHVDRSTGKLRVVGADGRFVCRTEVERWLTEVEGDTGLRMARAAHARCSCSTCAAPWRVHRWVNIADVGDLVAIPRGLGGHFQLDEDHEVRIATFDFHRVRTYLAHATTTETVRSAMRL